MKHELRPWGLSACTCGYRRYDADRSHANRMLDLHFRSSHDISEHLAIIKQLVSGTAEQQNVNQDMALAILHLVDIIEMMKNGTGE